MDGKFNTPRTVCRAIVAVAFAAAALAAIVGCESTGSASRKESVAAVIQAAYDLGGREAVSNGIESLVAEGKLTPSQAVRLHALARLAYEGMMDGLATESAAATNAAPASACQGGCGDCSIPDAGEDCGDGNEDANCGRCADCKDGE